MPIGEIVQRASLALRNFAEWIAELLQSVWQSKSGQIMQDHVAATRDRIHAIISQAKESVETSIQHFADMSVGEVCRAVVALVVTMIQLLWGALEGVLERASGKTVEQWRHSVAQSWQDYTNRARGSARELASELSQKSLYELIALGKNRFFRCIHYRSAPPS